MGQRVQNFRKPGEDVEPEAAAKPSPSAPVKERGVDQDPTEEMTRRWTEAMPAAAAFIRSMIGQFHDAQDILQDVAVEVVRQFPSYDPQRSFTAWTLGIARNKIKAHYRDSATGKRVLGELAMERVAEAIAQMHEETSEVGEALRHCVEHVAPRARTLLHLRYVEDLRCAAIAERMSRTTLAVRVALHRLRVALMQCVKERRDAMGRMT